MVTAILPVLALSAPTFAQSLPTYAMTTSSPVSGGGMALSNTQVTPFTISNVGGGTWDYGTYLTFYGAKAVYSDYVNNHYKHSATAVIGATHSTIVAAATKWANATVTGYPWSSDAVYWHNFT